MNSTLEEIDQYFTDQLKSKPIICEITEENTDLESMQFQRKIFLPTVNELDFYARRKLNPCLFGVLSINRDGSIFPCPGIHQKIGKLFKDGSCTMEKGVKEVYWRKTKYNSIKCKYCGFKYICYDCSVVEGVEKYNCDYNANENVKLKRMLQEIEA